MTYFPNKAYTLYFYKGTVFPKVILFDSVEEQDSSITFTKKQAKDLIKNGLKNNLNIEAQKIKYIEQLNSIEEALFTYNNPSTEKGMKKVCKILNYDRDFINCLWMLNIEALIILKHLKNDENNGIMSFDFTNGKHIIRK